MAEVILDNVWKRYGRAGRGERECFALRRLNLVAADGEFIVLVGPSGCGKTTTLRLIAGLEGLTEGDIRIGGRSVKHDHPRDRNVAMVFQDFVLYPHMTAYQNMAFALRMRGAPRAEIDRKVRDAAAMLGIVDLLDRKPHAMSGGQRQRVALGRAIVHDPRCFLFDEPLSNLDAKLRMAMRAEIKALHQRFTTTTIYVTHDQEEAMTLADRVAVLAGGELQQVAPPLEIYRRPANRFVAEFFGSPAMNCIDGTIERRDGTLWFSNGADVRLPLAPNAIDRLAEYIDRPIVLGVRPEDVRDSRAEPNGQQAHELTLQMELTEVLGDQMNVHLRSVTGVKLIARCRARQDIQPGQRITVRIDQNALHFFEPGEFGRNLLHSPPA